ncbi:hypothetical protein C8A05DRAFT_32667 [Staphylotrichum tortipilum]|uniref:Mitochondrial large ribosomal subunit n=1 Tax=Staphylotrichum tortipilum TaxID=2831512 RepID=A0AAN6MNN7_9PEZI|nr:hypothetical protein C8A05DRAFT_32667 [Staphylotrichum longicolle]
MSLRVPSRRLLWGAPALTSAPTTTTASSLLPALQSLTLSASSTTSSTTASHPAAPSARSIHTTRPNQWWFNRKSKQPEPESLEAQRATAQETRNALSKQISSRVEGPAIFEDEIKDVATTEGTSEPGGRPRGAFTGPGASMVREHLARAVDPDPRNRVRWERKMVIRQVRRGTDPFSREPRAERIARTERQLLSRSPWLATSTKKLVHLAHQIQGKSVAEALVQMRFSSKKMAQEVRYQLEVARDLAVAERGMGLGPAERRRLVELRAGAAAAAGNNSAAETAALAAADAESKRVMRALEAAAGIRGNGKFVEIQDKDGRWLKIDDPTRMYVAEAWVNRGPWRDKVPEYRARGRMNILKRPTTSISIVLKEEKTRLREFAERQAKKARHGPWVHLPDRPVTAQRQYYSW